MLGFTGYTFAFELKPSTPERAERLLLFRITYERKSARFSTKQWIREEDFDATNRDEPLRLPDKQKEPKRHREVKDLNGALRLLRAKATTLASDASRAGEKLSAGELRDRLTGREKEAPAPEQAPELLDFVSYTEKYLHNRQPKVDVRTYERYTSYLTKLKQWLNGRLLTFEKLNAKGAITLLREFETWLLTEGKEMKGGRTGLSRNTTSKAIQYWRGVAQSAVDEELLTRNPFTKIEIGFTEPEIDFLNDQELEAFVQVPLDNWYLDLARDVWFFQFYAAGRRIGDVLALRWRDVDADGTWRTAAQKTAKRFNITLIREAAEIASKYRRPDSKPDDFVLPMLPNDRELGPPEGKIFKKAISSATALLNARLPVIAKKAEIDKHITTHVARHTFANIAIQRGVSIYELRDALEHSSVSMTEKYVRRFGSEAANKVIRKVHGLSVEPAA
jgi:integrase/recombinase XerD